MSCEISAFHSQKLSLHYQCCPASNRLLTLFTLHMYVLLVSNSRPCCIHALIVVHFRPAVWYRNTPTRCVRGQYIVSSTNACCCFWRVSYAHCIFHIFCLCVSCCWLDWHMLISGIVLCILPLLVFVQQTASFCSAKPAAQRSNGQSTEGLVGYTLQRAQDDLTPPVWGIDSP